MSEVGLQVEELLKHFGFGWRLLRPGQLVSYKRDQLRARDIIRIEPEKKPHEASS